MTIYDELIKRVSEGEKFYIDFETRTMKVGNTKLIDNGKYDKNRYLIYEYNIYSLHVLLHMIRELAEFESNDILMYIQREIWFSAEFGDISYQRAIALLQSTINYALADNETDSVKDELNDIGFEDEELCVLGYKDVFFEEEE